MPSSARSAGGVLQGRFQQTICKAVEGHSAYCEDCTAMVNTLAITIDLYRADVLGTCLPPDVRLRLFRQLDLEDLLESGLEAE